MVGVARNPKFPLDLALLEIILVVFSVVRIVTRSDRFVSDLSSIPQCINDLPIMAVPSRMQVTKCDGLVIVGRVGMSLPDLFNVLCPGVAELIPFLLIIVTWISLIIGYIIRDA